MIKYTKTNTYIYSYTCRMEQICELENLWPEISNNLKTVWVLTWIQSEIHILIQQIMANCQRAHPGMSLVNSSPPGQNGLHFTDNILDAFSWMKSFVFWSKFHLLLRVHLTITQHWFRWWLGAEWATSHYMNQCWPDSLMHICGSRGDQLNQIPFFAIHSVFQLD